MRRLLLSLLLAFAAPAYAQEIQALQDFYRNVNSLSGAFVQVTRGDNDEVLESSSGRLIMQRPDRFRWVYSEPFEQEIVADGKQLWVYDKDLEQVTVRPLSEVLGVGPALLLSGDFETLSRTFAMEEEGDGWLRLTPTREDWDFQSVRLRLVDGVPRVVEVDSGLGQITRLELRDLQRNPEIDQARFRFVPPKGVDVIAPGKSG